MCFSVSKQRWLTNSLSILFSPKLVDVETWELRNWIKKSFGLMWPESWLSIMVLLNFCQFFIFVYIHVSKCFKFARSLSIIFFFKSGWNRKILIALSNREHFALLLSRFSLELTVLLNYCQFFIFVYVHGSKCSQLANSMLIIFFLHVKLGWDIVVCPLIKANSSLYRARMIRFLNIDILRRLDPKL